MLGHPSPPPASDPMRNPRACLAPTATEARPKRHACERPVAASCVSRAARARTRARPARRHRPRVVTREDDHGVAGSSLERAPVGPTCVRGQRGRPVSGPGGARSGASRGRVADPPGDQASHLDRLDRHAAACGRAPLAGRPERLRPGPDRPLGIHADVVPRGATDGARCPRARPLTGRARGTPVGRTGGPCLPRRRTG
jgi:hypothetical protein